MSGCDPHDETVAYFMTHGTQDNVCSYPQYGVPQLDDFAEVNGCTPRSMPTPSGNTPSPNTQSTWVPQEAWNFFSQF